MPTGEGGYWFGPNEILNGTTWTDVEVPLPGSGGYGLVVTRIPGTTSFLLGNGGSPRTSR